MKRLLLMFFSLATAGIAYAACNCSDSSQTNSLNSSSTFFDIVHSEYKDSIDHCSKDKIYLKSEMIFDDGTNLYLQNDLMLLVIPFLYFDVSGYYVASESNHYVPWYKCTNPNCRYVWDLISHNSTFCPICKSPGKVQWV